MGISLTDLLLANKVITLDEFISVDQAIDLYYEMTEHASFNASKVTDARGEGVQGEKLHDGRISETAYDFTFSELAKKKLAAIAQDVADILGVDTNQMEPWQCTRYATGGIFDYHDDCGNWPANERLYTVMLTLRAADFGGGTHFPNLGLSVESKSARLVIWRNLNEDFQCDGKSQHAGMPVGKEGEEDEKMIVVTWVRIKEYVS